MRHVLVRADLSDECDDTRMRGNAETDTRLLARDVIGIYAAQMSVRHDERGSFAQIGIALARGGDTMFAECDDAVEAPCQCIEVTGLDARVMGAFVCAEIVHGPHDAHAPRARGIEQ